MIVMITAITASLNASIRPTPISSPVDRSWSLTAPSMIIVLSSSPVCPYRRLADKVMAPLRDFCFRAEGTLHEKRWEGTALAA